LTSADYVGYSEQRENGDPNVCSGKFRSMLLDIFGHCHSEKEMWAVDRNAVINYKQKVDQNIKHLKLDIESILS
jgi:hypothetical protein